MAKGRKRKAGKRTESGQLSRAGISKIVKPSEWVDAMRARYGDHYSSPIGRAFAAGLLGDGTEANERYHTARKFASLHRRVFGGDVYRCALNQSPRGANDQPLTDKDVADQEWLIEAMGKLDCSGCRPFFDQLISRQFTDYGPSWLDRLLATAHKDKRDMIVMDAAVKAIDTIVSGRRVPMIVYARD